MPAYYAMGYLSGVLFSVTTIGEHPHAKTPNAQAEARATPEKPTPADRCPLWPVASPRPTAAPHAGTTLAAAGRHARWALGEGGCHSHGHRGRGLGATVPGPGAAGSPPTATAGHRRTPLRRTVDADEPLT